MAFQTSVNTLLPPGTAGNFASANPRTSVISGPSGFVAGTAGAIVGNFAWIATDGITVTNAGTVAPDGFVANELQATILVWLSGDSLAIIAGNPVTLYNEGDYLVKVTVAAAVIGNKAFASTTDGSVQPGAAGAAIAGYIETRFVFRTAAAIGEVAKITSWGV